MRGEVEIYCGDKLLVREDNLIVDGAGTLLADIMTVSPSLSAIKDHATSSMLDTSNYTIQAISFGTAANQYQQNAHAYSEAKATLLSGIYINSAVIAVLNQRDPEVATTASFFNLSSYSPLNVLPHYPDPTLTTLELSSDVSAVVSGIDLSSIIPGNGQNLNLIPSAYHTAVFSSTLLSSLSSVCASLIGCWPAGSGQPTQQGVGGVGGTDYSGFRETAFRSSEVVYHGGGSGTNRKQPPYQGVFNEASSMDISGFVNMVMSGTPRTVAAGGYIYEMSSTYSGLCLSGSSNATSAINDYTVEYSVTMGSGDVGAANLYGGLFNMGLWTIDMPASLLKGNTPPYAFDPLNNPRTYRLFSNKSFTRNIAKIKDKNASPDEAGCINYKDLLIKWRLHFL